MKIRIKSFLFLILGLLCFSAGADVVVQAHTSGFSPEAGLVLIRDSSTRLRFSDILADTSRFTKCPARLNFNEGENVFWARLRVSNRFESDQEFILFFGGKWEYIEFYSDGAKRRQITGALVAMDKRSEKNPYSAASMLVRKGESQTFYARLAFRGTWQTPVKVFASARLKNEYLEERGEDKFIQALFIGSLLIMALYTLMLYVTLRDKSYLIYVLLLFFMGLTFMANYRFDFEYLFGAHPQFFQYMLRLPVYNLLVGPCVIIFAQSFLNTRIVVPRIHKAMNVLTGCILFFFIPCALRFPDNGWFISDMMGLPVVCISVFGGIRCWKKGYQPAKFYLIASVFSCLGILIFLLQSNFHLLPFQAKTYPMEIGMGLELFLYSFALSDKIRHLKTEVSNQQEHTVFQLNENEKLKDRMHRDLEEKNQERERISKDIHDELGAGLSKIRFMADTMQAEAYAPDSRKLSTIREIALDLTDNMRDLIQMFSRSKSSISDLLANLREYTSDYLEDFPQEYFFHFPDDLPEIMIPSEIHRQCFLICKEALHNIVKHSGATQVTFRSNFYPDKVLLELQIEDNGCGLASDTSGTIGHGLINMKQRAAGMGARLEIAGAPGMGCGISLQVPLARFQGLSAKDGLGVN